MVGRVAEAGVVEAVQTSGAEPEAGALGANKFSSGPRGTLMLASRSPREWGCNNTINIEHAQLSTASPLASHLETA